MVIGIGKGRTAKGQRSHKGGIIAALDVGSTKVACFIVKVLPAREGAEPQLKVMGVGHHASRGVRGATVVDIVAAEESIRVAVEQAERMAGVTLKDAIVGISCGQPQSRTINVEVSIAGHEVGEEDLRRAYATGRAQAPGAEREIIHCMPGSYAIDGSRGIRNPRGMVGDTMGVSMHTISAASGPMRNLEACVERCHLDIAGKVATPFAAGLATLVSDEMDLGATVIDMGGGTTSISVFFDGNLIFAEVLPVGGNHVTSDIARGLSTSLLHAERMKTLHGSALLGPNDGREMIAVPHLGEDDPEADSQIPRSVLAGIIQPRIEETFELVRDRLTDCGLTSISGRRVVLTGGAAQLNGAREVAARILSKQVRIGRATRLTGLGDAASGPSFAAVAGVAIWASQRPNEVMIQRQDFDAQPLAYGTHGSASRGFEGLTRWFKENF
ncbi:MAG: cell division protein FtsA [Alphaproteobacteria bacterium]|nr:cell division protein FtsA [Alphaproteobacteria bacterium]